MSKVKKMPSWAVREAVISYRTTRIDFDDAPNLGAKVASSLDVRNIAKTWIGSGTVERFVIFGLNNQNQVIAGAIMGQGSSSFAYIDRTEVARFLVLSGASAAIVAHNHPSGDPRASNDDLELTQGILELGKLLGVKILDHVIVTPSESLFSFLDNRLLGS